MNGHVIGVVNTLYSIIFMDFNVIALCGIKLAIIVVIHYSQWNGML